MRALSRTRIRLPPGWTPSEMSWKGVVSGGECVVTLLRLHSVMSSRCPLGVTVYANKALVDVELILEVSACVDGPWFNVNTDRLRINNFRVAGKMGCATYTEMK